MGVSWPKYLAALGIVIVGLIGVEAVAPRAAMPLVGLILLGILVTHPTFMTELNQLSARLRGGP